MKMTPSKTRPKSQPVWHKPHPKTPARRPRSLRDALAIIESLLDDRPFSGDLWNVLTALRGPDSRDPLVKYATTAVIRQAAFPSRPTYNGSVYQKDTTTFADRRRAIFTPGAKQDSAHFREHVVEAFTALKLELFRKNELD